MAKPAVEKNDSGSLVALALVPRLLGWPYDEYDPGLRKSFEVALHAGAALALLAAPPWTAGERRGRIRVAVLACAVAPP